MRVGGGGSRVPACTLAAGQGTALISPVSSAEAALSVKCAVCMQTFMSVSAASARSAVPGTPLTRLPTDGPHGSSELRTFGVGTQDDLQAQVRAIEPMGGCAGTGLPTAQGLGPAWLASAQVRKSADAGAPRMQAVHRLAFRRHEDLQFRLCTDAGGVCVPSDRRALRRTQGWLRLSGASTRAFTLARALPESASRRRRRRAGCAVSSYPRLASTSAEAHTLLYLCSCRSTLMPRCVLQSSRPVCPVLTILPACSTPRRTSRHAFPTSQGHKKFEATGAPALLRPFSPVTVSCTIALSGTLFHP